MSRNRREISQVRKATHSGSWYTDNGKFTFVQNEALPIHF